MLTLLKNCNINNEIQNLLIKDRIISYIGKNIPACDNEIDINNRFVIPGIIDPHVHVRDLQQAEKEDWTTVSAAALRGGVTTIFDMPNTRPPTVNLKYLNLKREKAKLSQINYKFNVAATSQNIPELIKILKTKPEDVAALKLFLAGSNSNEFVGGIEIIKQIFDISLKYDLPVIVHTELQKCIENYSAKINNPTVNNHNFMRNRECSIKGTELLINITKEVGNKLYLAHTSTAEEIDLVMQNKDKCNVFCETSPHHLLINEEILEKAGNFGKVNPPLRTKKDNDRILQGIIEGTVDTIATDHAPHKRNEKLKNYTEAPSGFPGLETSLPLLLNEVSKGSFRLEKLIEITSLNSSKIFKLKSRGKIEEGYFADLAIIDLNKTWKIEAENFNTKAKYSPYEGTAGKGDVIMTFVNGELKYKN
ncbi:MAG: dihydroorotase family protein [Bacteroidales bacterium]|nr:dihydroorotase family protein [Bacteroidales bacterium]